MTCVKQDEVENGRIIFKWIIRRGMDWIDPAHAKDRWWALVYAVMNL
jgi:hypothetical protein